MSLYLDLFLIAAVVVYIVDVSGWTDTWLGWLSRFTKRYNYPEVKSLRPFSCSKCMTWWVGLAYAWLQGELSLLIVAYIALLALLSVTLEQVFIFIRETLTNAVAKFNNYLNAKIDKKWQSD